MISYIAMAVVSLTILIGVGAKLYLGSSSKVEQAIEKVAEEVVLEEVGIDVNLNDLGGK